MKLEPDKIKTGNRQQRTAFAKKIPTWIFLIILSTIILCYNCSTAFLANLTYLPPTLYNRVYDCMTLEGAGAAVLVGMFILYPPQLFMATIRGLFLGGVEGALCGILVAIYCSSTRRQFPLLGAVVGSISGMTLGTTILPLSMRLSLTTSATHFFDLYALGGIHTIEIGCQYGAYSLALLYTSYLPILFLLSLIAIVGTVLLRFIANAISHVATD
ncbi:MAG: hypothetical protein ACFFCF_05860 [Promethearchaeota archaeon]